MKYRKIYYRLQKELANDKVLLLVGSRQVGKTTLLRQLRDSLPSNTKSYFLNLEDPDIKTYLNNHPEKLFELTGSAPNTQQVIFIDEIQYLDNPSGFLKYIYDEYQGLIKLVVSGSSSFYIDQKFVDSLMGRKKVFEVYTLDFEEFLDFKGYDDLRHAIFDNKQIPKMYVSELSRLFWAYMTYGGYPEIVLMEDYGQKEDMLKSFAFDYVKKDIYDGEVANTDKFLSMLKALADQSGDLVNMSELANTFNVSVPTVEKYLYIMQKSYHIALLKPFYTNIRKELTKRRKVYFYDLGFRNALMKNFEPVSVRYDRGTFFENLVFRELMFMYGEDSLRFWRNTNKNEVDFVLEEEKKAYEVKFAQGKKDDAKYMPFKKAYPQIDLYFLHYENIIQQLYQAK